jgi:agmatinase
MPNLQNFLGLDGEITDFENSKFVILPVSYDNTVSFLKGTANAPKRIIEVSEQLELFDEQLLDEFYHCGIHTHIDVGGNNKSPEHLKDDVYKTAKKILSRDKKIIAFGGEHSISLGLIQAAKEKYPDLSILQFDAHADLRDQYEDSKLNHACVMKRVFDMNIPFVGVGIRSFDKAQHKFMQQHQIKYYPPSYIDNNTDWIDEIISELSENIYITLDIDGLDPAYAPGTGTPEPGGLKYNQITDLIIKIGQKRNIISADIVEVIPNETTPVTEFTAARLAYKLIAAAQLNSL